MWKKDILCIELNVRIVRPYLVDLDLGGAMDKLVVEIYGEIVGHMPWPPLMVVGKSIGIAMLRLLLDWCHCVIAIESSQTWRGGEVEMRG